MVIFALSSFEKRSFGQDAYGVGWEEEKQTKQPWNDKEWGVFSRGHHCKKLGLVAKRQLGQLKNVDYCRAMCCKDLYEQSLFHILHQNF